MDDPVAEQRELTAIYVGRGLQHPPAQQVAEQLMAHDATSARPAQAALASAASFTVGAALPLVVAAVAVPTQLILWVAGMSTAFLGSLGAVAAQAGGASMPVVPGASPSGVRWRWG